MIKFKGSLDSVLLISLSTLLGAGATFALNVLLARVLEIEEFGIISTGLASVSILAPIVSFGFTNLWFNAIGRYGNDSINIIGESLKVMALNYMLILVVVGLYLFNKNIDDGVLIISAMLALHLLSVVSIEIISCISSIEKKYWELSVAASVPQLLRLLIIVVIVTTNTAIDIKLVVLVYFTIAFWVVYIAYYKIKHSLNGLDIEDRCYIGQIPRMNGLTGIYKRLSFYGFASILHIIFYQINIVLLMLFNSSVEVANYNAAFLLINAVVLLPNAIYQKIILPKVHNWIHYNNDLNKKVFKYGSYSMIVLGFILAIFLFSFSEIIILFVFVDKYSGASRVFDVMVFMIPMIFISTFSSGLLFTNNNIKVKAYIMCAVALLVLLNGIVFIPKYGAVGSAYGFLLANIMMSVLYNKYAKKILKHEMK